MCELYQTSKSNVSEHIKHIFGEGELMADSVVRNFRPTELDGKAYMTTFYNLDMIIALGYRVHSIVATRFRQWATRRLKEYITKGFTMDVRTPEKMGGGGYRKELLDGILTSTGEQLLADGGRVSHQEAMEHATTEYRKYKQRTLCDVEQNYLNAIKAISNKSKNSKKKE